MKPKTGLSSFKETRRRNGGLPKLRGMFISPAKIIQQLPFQGSGHTSSVPGPYSPKVSMRFSRPGAFVLFDDPENELVVTTEEWKMLRYND